MSTITARQLIVEYKNRFMPEGYHVSRCYCGYPEKKYLAFLFGKYLGTANTAEEAEQIIIKHQEDL